MPLITDGFDKVYMIIDKFLFVYVMLDYYII